MEKIEKFTSDGFTAYDILHMHDCPIRLPHARSMTQASIDFYSRQDQIIKWYEENKLNHTWKQT